MIVLALDSTGPDCSACLVRDETVLAHASERIGRGHAERLAPMVAELFEEAGISPTDVDRVAVCTGPGSFTGLRVALSLAKGFALPRRLPVLGFNALDVEAAAIRARHDDPLAIVYRDVKRGQVFAAKYGDGKPHAPPKAMTLDDVIAMGERLQAVVHEAPGCDVRVMAALALTADPVDYPAQPLYARAPDAKLPSGLAPPA